jgi:dual specificity tyrosine-phosphorylation-regulated kinase 1
MSSDAFDGALVSTVGSKRSTATMLTKGDSEQAAVRGNSNSQHASSQHAISSHAITSHAFAPQDSTHTGALSAGLSAGRVGASTTSAGGASGASAPITTTSTHTHTSTAAATATTVPSSLPPRPTHVRPLYKLSVNLIETYKLINKVYYDEKARRKKEKEGTTKSNTSTASSSHVQTPAANNAQYDDDNYDYIIRVDEIFNERYRIKEKIGKGSFGQVIRAVDMETNAEVAVKIIKSKKPFTVQARTEIELLESLRTSDAGDQHNIVRLLTHFMYRGHQCLVFEMLSLNLYELLKNTEFRGVSLNLIRKFSKQILHALAFLAKPSVNIIHCDLKPENILLRSPRRSAIKVIDFGSSCRHDKRMYSYIQSRFYRSPEVMLGLQYSTAIDMWSLGCILVEMHTGEPLFAGKEQFDQMKKLTEVLGNVPNHLIMKAPEQNRNQFFEQVPTSGFGGGFGGGFKSTSWRLRSVNPSGKESSSSRSRSSNATLSEIIGAETGGPRGQRLSEEGHTPANYAVFVDLVSRMLDYDPDTRIKPEEALRHPFIEQILGGEQGGGEGGAGGRRSQSERSHRNDSSPTAKKASRK